jgi:predicted HTH transcriptional regulator
LDETEQTSSFGGRHLDWQYKGYRIVLLEFQPATSAPVAFKGTEYIRVGGIKKRLKDHLGKEKELWLTLAGTTFETAVAMSDVTGDEVLVQISKRPHSSRCRW